MLTNRKFFKLQREIYLKLALDYALYLFFHKSEENISESLTMDDVLPLKNYIEKYSGSVIWDIEDINYRIQMKAISRISEDAVYEKTTDEIESRIEQYCWKANEVQTEEWGVN